VRLDGKPIRLMANALALSGPGAAKIAPGALRGVGAPLPEASTNDKRIVSWIGRAPQRIMIGSQPVGQRFETSFAVAITARSADGGLTTAYSAILHWSRLNARDSATIADLVETSPARGFQKAPEIVLEKSGEGVILALAFTPIASGPGQISIR
jgi:hypothetical protein